MLSESFIIETLLTHSKGEPPKNQHLELPNVLFRTHLFTQTNETGDYTKQREFEDDPHSCLDKEDRVYPPNRWEVAELCVSQFVTNIYKVYKFSFDHGRDEIGYIQPAQDPGNRPEYDEIQDGFDLHKATNLMMKARPRENDGEMVYLHFYIFSPKLDDGRLDNDRLATDMGRERRAKCFDYIIKQEQ